MLRVIRRIVAWCGSYGWRVYLGMAISVLSAIAIASPAFVAALTMGRVVEDVQGGAPPDPSLVWQSALAILACVLLRFAVSYAKNRIQESVGYERAPEVRIEVGDVLKRVPLGYFSRVSTGDILSTVTTNLSTLELEGVRQADAAVGGYLSAAVITAWLFSVSPWCGMVSVCAVLATLPTLRAVNRASARLAARAHADQERLSGSVVELFRGLGMAKSYGHAGAVLRPFSDDVDALSATRVSIEKAYTPINALHKGILEVASVALLGVAAAGALAGEVPLWSFVGIALFSTTIFGAIGRLTDAAHMFADLDDVLDRLERIEKAPFIDGDGRDVVPERHDIRLEHVSFSYEGRDGVRREVLHDVSLDVPEGSTCAIVGPSGSGKTTVSSLMARFWDVDSGRVCVGGHDVREFTCDSLLQNFSMVFQDVYLFDDTIEANIAFGCEGATHEQVVKAARRARCDEFVSQLPQGYDTVVGEGGSALSGGERQRVSIARALLKDAPIVILDEATASMDPENERLVQLALTELTRDKTVVVIAHRLPTVEQADQILVMDQGRIVQRGTHRELLEREGLYRDFVEARAQAEGWRLG